MPGVAPEKLLERLARGQDVPAIVLLGTDSYLREMCRSVIVNAYVPEGARDWAVTRLSVRESGWDGVFERAQTLPMLARRQVIIVEQAESLERLGDKSRGEVLDELGKYFESPAPFTVLLIEAAALDGRQKFSKLLNDKALVVKLAIERESLVALASQMARGLGAEIDREAAVLLVETVNDEPARVHIELEKLAAYVLGRGRITTRDVEELVVSGRKNTVWQLADMLVNRRRDAALEFLDNLLREGEQPAGIVGALAWMYRKLIEARDLPPNANGYQAARELGMHPEAAEAAVRSAHRVPKKELLAGLMSLAEADSQLKSANPNPRAFMEFLVARLTASSSSAA
jgi:DNA polymerase III subunit delta